MPERNSCATMEWVADSFRLCACWPVRGATTSPSSTVSSAKPRPNFSRVAAICGSVTPLVRITVYSLLVASWVIATMPPISTASGINS